MNIMIIMNIEYTVCVVTDADATDSGLFTIFVGTHKHTYTSARARKRSIYLVWSCYIIFVLLKISSAPARVDEQTKITTRIEHIRTFHGTIKRYKSLQSDTPFSFADFESMFLFLFSIFEFAVDWTIIAIAIIQHISNKLKTFQQ